MQSSPNLMSAQPSRPWLALALTFLFLGIGYALPFRLVPYAPAGLWQGNIAPEVLNLYALTAFAGWGHFVYAWRGQLQGTKRMSSSWRTSYWAAVAVCILLLILFRFLIGVAAFSALVWIWFIAHFVKAELTFAGPDSTSGRPISWQPVVAFAWLTFVLFNGDRIQDRPWMLFLGCTAIGILILVSGGWRRLAVGASFLPALALFFDGEAFVWGAYGRYMHPTFRIGVYVFHVAGASFFHYLGSYAYGNARNSRDRWLLPLRVAAINLAVLAVCVAVAWIPAMNLLTPVLGLAWFTLSVGAHLAASDLLPAWKRIANRPAIPVEAAP